MSKIYPSNTRFERRFISELKRRTRKRFRTNVKSLRGKPDIVFQKARICVFLDSDFWHGWQYPRWKNILKNDFWKRKIENTRARDKATTAHLRKNDWTVVRVWEHKMKKNFHAAVSSITDLMQ